MKTKNRKSESQEISRRSFMKLALSLLGTIASIEIVGMSLAYLKSRSDENTVGGIVMTGAIDDFAPDSVTAFEKDGFFLIRDEQGDFLAVHRRCPHLGCNVIWQPEKDQFVCPCHASNFDNYGIYESAPVPRPLDTLEVKIEDAYVYVNTSLVSSRENFDPSQMTSPRNSTITEVSNE